MTSPIKQVILWTLYAIVIYIVFILSSFPVTVVHSNINQALQKNNIYTSNLSGSIFKGSSDIKLPQLSFTLEWKLCAINFFNPLGVCLRAHNNAFDIAADASMWLLLGKQSWRIHNLYGKIDIDRIMPLLPIPKNIQNYLGTVTPQGKIQIEIEDIVIAKKGKNITIEDWLGKISLKKLLAAEYHLGSYNLILSSSEKKGHITPIMNIQGGDPTLKIKAKLSMHENTYNISSQLTTNNPMISAGLSMVTTTTGKNAFSYKRVSNLPWNEAAK
jgi:hypothetical protein